MTKVNFHIFYLVGGYCKKFYIRDRVNAEVQKFHEGSDEKYFKWVSIIDASLFLRKVYFGSRRMSVGKNLACDY